MTKKSASRWFTCVCAVIALLACSYAGAQSADPDEAPLQAATTNMPTKRVLLLHSYTSRVRYTRVQDIEIREGIARGYPGNVRFFNVELDFNLDEEMESWSSVHEFLQQRYEKRGLDLIIATDTPAMRFLQQYGPETFPNVPIVFSASKEAPADSLREQCEITGVVESLDVRGTLDLMLQMQPGVRRLLLINNNSVHGRELKDATRAALASMSNALETEWIEDADFEQVRERIARARPEEGVLFLTYWDNSGKRSTLESTLGEFCKVCPRPVFVLYDAYMGIGPIGGCVASARAYALTASNMAVRVLMGTPASQIPMVESINPTLLDARQIERFAIPPENIPAEAEILFTQPTFLERNAWAVAITATLTLAQAGIICWLVMSLRKVRRTTIELQASEARFRLLGERMPGMPYATLRQPNGNRIAEYLGPGLESLFGNEQAAIIRADFNKFFDCIHPDDMPAVMRERIDAIEQRRPFECEYRVKSASGQWLWVRASAIATHLPDGAIRWHGVLLSIDAAKRAEIALRASEERFRALGENLPGLAFTALVGPDGASTAEYLGPGLELLLGLETAAAVRADVNEFVRIIHPHDVTSVIEERAVVMREKQSFDNEFRLKGPDGKWIWVRATASPTFLDDGHVRWHGVMLDITARYLAEAALRTSEERYRYVFQATNDVIWDWDLASGRIHWSESLHSSFRDPSQGLITPAEENFDRIHSSDRERVRSDVMRVIAGTGSAWRDEYRFQRTDGSFAWVVDRARVVRDSEGNAVRLIGAITDVSALRETEQRLQVALAAGKMAAWDWDVDADMLEHSLELCPMFALPASAGPTPASALSQHIHAEDAGLTPSAARPALEGKNVAFSTVYRVEHPDGSTRWIACEGRPVKDDPNRPRRLVGVSYDITHLKLAEAALRESEVRHRSMIESLPVAVLIHNGFDMLYANRAAVNLLGAADLSELLRHSVPDFTRPEYREFAAARCQKVMDTGLPADRREIQLVTLSGRRIEAEMLCTPLTIGDRRLIQTTLVDLTDRKLAEQALRQSEERFRQITENAAEVFWLADYETKAIQYISPAFETVWGVPREGFLNRTTDFFSTIHPEDRERSLRATTDSASGFDYEYRIVRPDGAVRWIRDRAYPVPDQSGRVVRIAGVAQDITEAKAAEQSLHRTSLTQQLLLSELDHRVKNSLSGLLTLIDLTRAATNDIQSFADSIRARVMAMASVHSMLSEGQWAPIVMPRIMRSLCPAESAGVIHFEGPEIEIPARQVTALAMIVQELFTNSLKHGAAGRRGGQVAIRWLVNTTESGSIGLLLEWMETGGPPVRLPIVPGVGTRLIEGFCRFELNGECRFNYEPDRLSHRLRVLLDTPGGSDRPSAPESSLERFARAPLAGILSP